MNLNIKKKTSIGIDLGHHRIKAVELESTAKGWSVVRTGSIETPVDGIRDGVVVDPPSVGHALKQLFRESKFSSADIPLSPPLAPSVLRTSRCSSPRWNEATLRKNDPIRGEAGMLPGSVGIDQPAPYRLCDSSSRTMRSR